MWLLKPAHTNRGKGVCVFEDLPTLHRLLTEDDSKPAVGAAGVEHLKGGNKENQSSVKTQCYVVQK